MTDDDLSRSTAAMAVGTLLSRLTGFGRFFAIAYALGFARLGDAYNLANTTPNIIYDLVLGGVLSATLIPVFIEHLSGDDDEAWQAVSAVVTVVLTALAAVTAFFALAAPLVIRLYLAATPHSPASADQRAVAVSLLRFFAPQVFLLGAITLTQAILNARRRFANPAFTPIANNLLTIGVLLSFPHIARSLAPAIVRHDQRGLLWLGLGTTAGYVLPAALQVPSVRRAGGRVRFVWNPRHPAVRSVIRLSGWLVGVVLANQLAFVLVAVLANRRPGDFSAYTGAYQFFLLPHAIFAVSIGTALTPDLSARWAAHELDVFSRRLSIGVRTTLVVLVPAAVGYALLARPIIGVALQHGRLTPYAAHRTATALVAFAVGLPGFSTYLMLMRAYQAMKDTRTMFGMYVLENGINVIVAVAVFRRYGVVGLAAAWSVAYSVSAVVAFAHLRSRTASRDGRAMLATMVRTGAAAALMGVVVVLARRLLGEGVVALGVAVGAGATVYLGAARLLGVDELEPLLGIWRRWS